MLDWLGTLSFVETEVNKVLANKPPVNAATGAAVYEDDKPFRIKYPRLWSFLTDQRWEGGEERRPATVSIFPDGGCFKIMLKEPNWGLILFAASNTPSDLFAALEARLNDSGADWRVDRRAAGEQAKRVKRPGA